MRPPQVLQTCKKFMTEQKKLKFKRKCKTKKLNET